MTLGASAEEKPRRPEADSGGPERPRGGPGQFERLSDLCRRILSTSEWEVWRLSELEGFPPEEVARRLKSTARAVRSLLRRIRARVVREIASADSPPLAEPEARAP